MTSLVFHTKREIRSLRWLASVPDFVAIDLTMLKFMNDVMSAFRTPTSRRFISSATRPQLQATDAMNKIMGKSHLLPENAKDLVSHAMIKIGESELMFSDTFPGQDSQSGNH